MQAGLKWTLLGTLALVLVAGGEVAYLHHERNADVAPKDAASTFKRDPDDLVYVKREQPSSFKDAKDLKGRTLWVSAGGQMDYYPYNGHAIDFAKSAGLLQGADKVTILDAVQQPVPKTVAVRIPQGKKQVLLIFNKAGDPKDYAVPVGYFDGTNYIFSTDDIFFYDDPHVMFKAWGPKVWAAIDAHKAEPGMTEREVQMALGQVITPHGNDIGDRTVDFDNSGHPVTVTFANGKSTTVTGG